MRGEVGIYGRGGGRGRQRKCLELLWKIHHERDYKGISTGARRQKSMIEITSDGRTAVPG